MCPRAGSAVEQECTRAAWSLPCFHLARSSSLWARPPWSLSEPTVFTFSLRFNCITFNQNIFAAVATLLLESSSSVCRLLLSRSQCALLANPRSAAVPNKAPSLRSLSLSASFASTFRFKVCFSAFSCFLSAYKRENVYWKKKLQTQPRYAE